MGASVRWIAIVGVLLSSSLAVGCDGKRRRGWIEPPAPSPGGGDPVGGDPVGGDPVGGDPVGGGGDGGDGVSGPVVIASFTASIDPSSGAPGDQITAQLMTTGPGTLPLEEVTAELDGEPLALTLVQPDKVVFTLPACHEPNLTHEHVIVFRAGDESATVKLSHPAVAPTLSLLGVTDGSRGGGVKVVITGTGFVAGMVVRFGGVDATDVEVASATELSCVTPAGDVGSVDVTVIHPEELEASLEAAFAYTNAAPEALDAELDAEEDGSLELTLEATDADGDALTFTVLTGPAHGKLGGEAPDLTYTPDADWHGEDSFTFEVSDGLTTATAKVRIMVAPVNDAPEATDGSLSVRAGKSATIELEASDVDGDALTFAILSPPAHGALTGTPPELTYTPEVGFEGEDSFTFTASDGALTSAAATITITVTPGLKALKVSPAAGPAAGGFALTITGAGFEEGMVVTLGGEECTDVVVVSETSITCTAPAGAPGRADLVVTAPDEAEATLADAVLYEGFAGSKLVTSTAGPNEREVAVAVSADGVLHVTWRDDRRSGTNSDQGDIYYRRSADGGLSWTGEVRVNQGSATSTGPDQTPCIAVVGSVVMVAWVEGSTGSTYLRRSTDGGASWTEAEKRLTSSSGCSNPSIAASGTTALVAWTRSGDVYVSRSTNTGSSFSGGDSSSVASSALRPTLALDGSNAVLAYHTSSSGTRSRRSTNGGSSWGSAVTVSASGTNANVAMEGTKAVIVWQTSTGVSSARSADGGATWTNGAAVVATAHVLGRQMVRVSGRAIVPLHRATGGSYLSFSSDDGATWSALVRLDENDKGAGAAVAAAPLDGALVVLAAYEDTSSPRRVRTRAGVAATAE
ncbi:MAG: tandem-95 repeat protein [Planctomycetes bacterium]|nr:tandem-95 repeat protein [Planctomycetota bacterium]